MATRRIPYPAAVPAGGGQRRSVLKGANTSGASHHARQNSIGGSMDLSYGAVDDSGGGGFLSEGVISCRPESLSALDLAAVGEIIAIGRQDSFYPCDPTFLPREPVIPTDAVPITPSLMKLKALMDVAASLDHRWSSVGHTIIRTQMMIGKEMDDIENRMQQAVPPPPLPAAALALSAAASLDASYDLALRSKDAPLFIPAARPAGPPPLPPSTNDPEPWTKEQARSFKHMHLAAEQEMKEAGVPDTPDRGATKGGS